MTNMLSSPCIPRPSAVYCVETFRYVSQKSRTGGRAREQYRQVGALETMPPLWCRMQRRGHSSRSGEPLEGRAKQNLLVSEPFCQWTAMVCGMGRHPLEAQEFSPWEPSLVVVHTVAATPIIGVLCSNGLRMYPRYASLSRWECRF